ncbi:MAG: SRPBCC domain-containing protein [Pseudomonadota bacterium]
MNEHHRLEIQRRLKARPEAVYDAWTRPDILARWWGPEGARIGDHSFDVTEGGSWRTVMVTSEGNEHTAVGTYRELTRPDRIVTTWAWEDGGIPGEESLVTVTFEAVGSETLMTLVHENFASKDSVEPHRMGWTSALSCLEALWAEA